MVRRRTAALAASLGLLACDAGSPTPYHDAVLDGTGAPVTLATAAPGALPSSGPDVVGPTTTLPPNEHGRVPILEYHIVGDSAGRWSRQRDDFRRDLQMLYERGYRPVTAAELVDGALDLPAGTSPVVFTFDDSSPSQFRYLERNGQLEIDPSSAVGIWLEFTRSHPGWRNAATFCMLPGATHGHAFFGDKGIQGQQTAWRFRKLQFLAAQGFELCNHTLWHANLAKYDDARVQEQIARGVMAIDSAVPGYRVRTFALPLGVWPRNRALAKSGSWTDPRTKRVVRYDFDAILEVAGQPNPAPGTPGFDPLSLDRLQMPGVNLPRILDQLERDGRRYVSDGRPGRAVAGN
jgi:peptidoglycan/xylan/chitin deacetylase (PgdA/CDA1 family)